MTQDPDHVGIPDDYDEDKPICQVCGDQDHVLMPETHNEKLFEANLIKRRHERVQSWRRLFYFLVGFASAAVAFGHIP